MSDELKDIVNNARADYEVYDFNVNSGWGEIRHKVSPKKKRGWGLPKTSGVAACLLLVAISTFYYIQSSWSKNDELSEIEHYYTMEINQKVTLVKSHLGNDGILQDLEAMDQTFAELKADLKDNVDNEEVISAMMENYQLKLKILEEILNELEKENSEKLN